MDEDLFARLESLIILRTDRLEQAIAKLDTRVGAFETRMDRLEMKVDNFERDLIARTSNLETLIINVKDSLERQFEGLSNRMEAQSLRFERHGADIQSGRRHFAKTGEWQEKVDTTIEAIQRRLDRLEKNQLPAA